MMALDYWQAEELDRHRVRCPHCRKRIGFGLMAEEAAVRTALKAGKTGNLGRGWPRMAYRKMRVPANLFLFAPDDLHQIGSAFNEAFRALPRPTRDRILRVGWRLPEWAFESGSDESEFCFGDAAAKLSFRALRQGLRALLGKRVVEEWRLAAELRQEDRGENPTDEERAEWAEEDASDAEDLAKERSDVLALVELPGFEFAVCLVCIGMWDDEPLAHYAKKGGGL